MLSSPWQLFVAITAYRDPASAPRDMLSAAHQASADLREHLLDRLVPAVVANHPCPDGSHYPAADVTRWLGALADHLAAERARGASGTDIHLNDLWRLAGPRLPRYLQGGLTAILYALLWSLGFGPPWFSSIGAFVLFLSGSRLETKPQRSDFRRLRHPGLPKLAEFTGSVVFSVVVSLVSGILRGCAGDVGFGVVFGAVLGAGVGVSLLVEGSAQAVKRPSVVLYDDLFHQLAFGVVLGVAAGVAFGVTAGVAGVGYGVVVRFGIACVMLARRRVLPLRLARFLDWAYKAGLLRLSGVACQFRHLELQEWAARQAPR